MVKKSNKRTNKQEGQKCSFRSKHPLLRRVAGKLGDYTDRFIFVYSAIIILFTTVYLVVTALAVALKWYTWDQIIATAATHFPMLCSLVSTFAIPIATNEIGRQKEAIARRYERNKELYSAFLALLIEILKEKEDFDRSGAKVKSFFAEHYSEMAITWPQSLLWDAEELYEECQYKSTENMLFYIKRCIMRIRKEAGLKDDFSLSHAFIALVSDKR